MTKILLTLIIYSLLIQINSQMEKVAQRISESVDDLGLQLDILYKLPQKHRQFYLQKINSFKSTLLSLKSNLRQNNQTIIQRQFEQTNLAINKLKKDLNDLVRQNLENHQNKLNTKVGERKSVSSITKNNNHKQYEELLNNLVQKTTKIESLNTQISVLKGKQETKNREFQTLKEQNFQLQVQIKQLTMQNIELSSSLSTVHETLRIREDELEIIRISDRNSMQICDKASLQIHCLKAQLALSKQKIQNFEQLAQINIRKAKIVQQNLQKMQKQAQCLNKQYQRKQSEYLKKIGNLQKLHNNSEMLERQNGSLEKQIQRGNQDIKILEIQLNRFQNGYYQLKNRLQGENNQLKKMLQKEKQDSIQNNQNQRVRHLKRQQILERQCYNLQNIIIKQEESIRSLQDDVAHLKHLLDKTTLSLQEKGKDYEELIQKYKRQTTELNQDKHLIILDLEIQKKEYSKISEQIRKTLDLNRKLEEELQCLAERHRGNQKIRSQQHMRVKQYQIICQQNKKTYAKLEDKYKQISIQNQYMKQSMQLLQNRLHICENQLKQTKVRLHKAKIETIHDLRTALF